MILLRVTDLKQQLYCPRVPYWIYVSPVERRLPPKVAFGAADHALLSRLEKRRTLRAYGLREGERRFRVPVGSQELGLTGILDALIETEEERIPIEYKDTLGGLRKNHRIQLCAYGMMLRETDGPPVKRGLLFIIPTGRVHEVIFTSALERQVREAARGLRETLETERFPPPADRAGKCRDCEFLRFCGDRYPAPQTGELRAMAG